MVRLGRLFLTLAVLGAPPVSFLSAEPQEDRVEVVAARVPEIPASTPSAVTVLSSEELHARGVRTLAEALVSVPGVTITSYGPRGSLQSVSLHGSTSNQVLILIDGVRVNDAMSGGVDLSLISIDGVERIEVLRDGASALFGADAVGGVVNLITKRTAAPLRLVLENQSYQPSAGTVGYGFSKAVEAASPASLFDGQDLRLSGAPRMGDAIVRWGVRGTRAANGYTFTDKALDRRKLQNADYLGAGADASIFLPKEWGRIAVDGAVSYDERGVPGSQDAPTPGARQTDRSVRASTRFDTDRFFSDLLDFALVAHASVRTLDYADANTPENNGRHELFSAGMDVHQKAWLSDRWSLGFGASGTFEKAASNTLGAPTREMAAVYVQPLFDGNGWSLRPALRYEFYSDVKAAPLAPLGLSLGLGRRVSEGEVLRATINRSYRVPTFQDLYWPSADGAEGNPELVPETSYGAEIGYEKGSGSTSLRTTGFVRYVEDVILWQPGTDAIWRPSNFGVALYPGFESEYKTVLGSWTVAVDYTFLYSYALSGTLALSDNKRLPMTPLHAADLTVGSEGLVSWSVKTRYVGLRYLRTSNTASLPSYFTADALLRWKFAQGSSVYGALDNLFGEDYQLTSGYAMPGTRLRLGLETEWK